MVKRWIVTYSRYFARSARFRVRRLLSGETPQRVKVLGLQRTGTNYLEQLIAGNTNAEVLLGTKPTSLRPIWKHALPRDENVEALTAGNATPVLLSKHPYSWVLSLDAGGEIPSWKRQMARIHPELFQDGRPCVEVAMKLYREFYAGWLRTGIAWVRLESLPSELPRLLERLGLAMRSESVIEPRRVPQSKPRPAADSGAPRRVIAEIDRLWDDALMETLGYTRGSAAEPSATETHQYRPKFQSPLRES